VSASPPPPVHSRAGTLGSSSALLPRAPGHRAGPPRRGPLFRSFVRRYLPVLTTYLGRKPLPLDGRPL